jgi:TP901 family phage tail tape measure protein
MATDSLGEYKVVVTADYSQLKSQFEAMSKYVSATTSTIADSLNKTMGGINASMIGQLKSATEQLKSSFNGLETATRKSGDGFQSYAKQIKDAEIAAQRCHQEITSLQNKMADSSVTDPKDVARLEQLRAKFRGIREQTDQLKAAQADYNARINETQNLEQMAAKAKKQADQEGMKALREREREQAKASQQEAQQIRKNAADRQRQINALNIKYRIAYEEINKYMQAHAKMSEAVFIRLQGRITAIADEMRKLGAMPVKANPLAGMNYDQYASGFSRLADAAKAFKHHMMWMASAAAIGGFIALPTVISKTTEEFDALNTKIMQNMELASKYNGNAQKLHSDMNRMAKDAIVMSQGYGISVNEVQDAMQILSRRFKDAGTAVYLTDIALKMSKLDMVDTKQSAKDLEAVMLQFGMGAKQAKDFLNDFSVICHTARISGTDMLMALERSGSAFKAMNMGAREAMAAIAAVSTVTGKSGATIGDSWKSILANMDFKKATAALEAYNIKLYEVGQNGAKTMRSGTAVLSEILATYQKLDDEGRRKLATAIAGGRRKLAA